MLAEARRGEQKIGTTSRGIGPAYEDKIGRRGIRVGDLADRVAGRRARDGRPRERRRPQPPRRQRGDEVAGRAGRPAPRAGSRLQPLVADTSLYLHRALAAGKRVMFEGAQGTLLDIDHGTYPYVTSSNSTAGGAATGLGVGPGAIGDGAGRRQGLHDARRRRSAADRAVRRDGRAAARDRAGVRRVHRPAAPLRLVRRRRGALRRARERPARARDHEARRPRRTRARCRSAPATAADRRR